MLTFAIRGVVLLGVLSWYSATVWKMIDGYFKDQFRAYLQEEYRKHPRIKADIESAGAVDKGPVPSELPAEPSLSHGIAETYDSNAVCPADIADACQRATASSRNPEETVAGGTSEIAAAVDTDSTDKNAFPVNAARSAQESRKPPSGSDTRDKERRPGVINQDGDREEDAIEGSVLASPASSSHHSEKPRRRLGKRESSRVSKEVSKEISREKPSKRRVNTFVLTNADFAAARLGTNDDEDDDFSEFEEEEKDQRVRKEGILVSELPFKPKADIGGLDRITAEEFCPLTLEDETSCRETTTWP